MNRSAASEYQDYKARCERIERRYEHGTKSVDAKYLDGHTFEEHYKRVFKGDDLTKDRNKYRTPFELARDRILYSPLLSRLSNKTHLLTAEQRVQEDRLTHTMKVVQIARSLSQGLKLNEDLCEAIAWGHDVGHPPFGHEGGEALNEWVTNKIVSKQQKTFNGFENGLPMDIEEEYRPEVEKYFFFGNDPEETPFMHGRHSFKLLTFKRKVETRRYVRFLKQVMYGIWRHSTENAETDQEFKFERSVGGRDVSLEGRTDMTPEAQVVRYSDDISWVVSDLEEGLYHEIIDLGDITPVIGSVESTQAETLTHLLQENDLDKIYTLFISSFIKQNKQKLEKKQEEDLKLGFSEGLGELLRELKSFIRENIHTVAVLERACRVNRSRIKALCDWYFENPEKFIEEFKILQQRTDFPIRIPIVDRKPSDKNDYEIYRWLIKESDVYRIATIVDFVSVLTDQEVRKLSETTPITNGF